MYKILSADKDSYITNRVIGTVGSGTLMVNSNVGQAGTLDLFKLYGATYASGNIPNTELTRLLVHFDLSPVQTLVNDGKLNVNDSSFNCYLKMFDVYGGQTTPQDFDVKVFPLSRSFSEGNGRDVVYYSDFDVSNFLSSSYSDGAWFITGCAKGGGSDELCDYITSSNGISFNSTQHFTIGEEDLNVDVTKIVSATLAGTIPDSGMRISFSQQIENDKYSYFVKRFASRSAYNTSKRPRLIVKYDDSLQDDTQLLRFDTPANVFLRNYSYGDLSNILSGSALSAITGSNCLTLKLSTQRSDGSGSYNIYFTGSQYSNGLNSFTGIYSASVFLPQTDAVLKTELLKSGSVKFTPIWSSLDGTVTYLTGTSIYAYPPQTSTKAIDFSNYVISTSGLKTSHRSDEEVFVRLNIFNHSSPYIKLVKRPMELPGIVIKKCYYQIRDYSSNEILIPFDETYNSTRVSSDDSGMYFKIDMTNLYKDRSYALDVMISLAGNKNVYKTVNVFNVSDSALM